MKACKWLRSKNISSKNLRFLDRMLGLTVGISRLFWVFLRFERHGGNLDSAQFLGEGYDQQFRAVLGGLGRLSIFPKT